MASLATGSVNFPNIIYENSASFVESLAAQMKEHGVSPEIEVFDLSHIYGARKLADLGLIKDRPHVQFGLIGVRPKYTPLNGDFVTARCNQLVSSLGRKSAWRCCV